MFYLLDSFASDVRLWLHMLGTVSVVKIKLQRGPEDAAYYDHPTVNSFVPFSTTVTTDEVRPFFLFFWFLVIPKAWLEYSVYRSERDEVYQRNTKLTIRSSSTKYMKSSSSSESGKIVASSSVPAKVESR